MDDVRSSTFRYRKSYSASWGGTELIGYAAHIQIEVKDNGIGISAERLAQIQKQLKNPEPMESSSGNEDQMTQVVIKMAVLVVMMMS